MAEIPEKSMSNVRVKGPFWSADVEVLKLAEPQKNWAFRNLFLDNTPRRGLGEDNLYLPGTLLVLCIVKRVKISPTSQQSYTWMGKPQEKLPTELTIDRIQQLLNAGNLSLLLVQVSPEAWSGDFPQKDKDNQAFFPEELTCIAGEIHLDALKQQQNNAKAELYKALNLEQVPNGLQGRDKAARLFSEVSVHSSGLSIYGKTKLPWQDEKLSAPFQLAKLLPDLSPNNRQFRLTVERERLTDTERSDWSKAWKQLSTYLNPKNPLNGRSDTASLSTPNWVTLEIANPLDIPRLYWKISSWMQAPALKFSPDDISLLLSDQQPYDQKNPPTSLGRVLLREISVIHRQNSDPSQDLLEIVVNAGVEGQTTGETLSYLREEISGNWQESFTFSNLNVAFSPIEAPQFLRKRQELPAPDRSDNDEVISPAILWGFMPLENGWAQLPIPNLTEQIYLDSGLAKFTDEDEPIKPPSALIQGAVSIGNDRPEVLAAHKSEQPWSITLTNAQRLQEGRWVLKKVTRPDKTVEFQVTRITLNILDPEVTLNGLFWLSTGKPTPEDALPDLKNWISGLRSLPLKTVKPELDLFPSPVIIALEKLEFSLRSQPSTSEPPSALLKAWKFAYKAHEAVFGKMVEQNILPADTFSQYLPLIWQRHASLPMIQALPLTQTQSPPNYPSASRQLVPFELGTQNSQNGKFAVPKDWLFGVSGDNGAAAWPQLMRQAQPAREWQSLFDLPLVSLSIPGVILDPKANAATIGLPLDPATQLPVQYRFDLPYTDEINALAQLPKVPRNPDEVSPLPDSPPPQPPKPLTRETFAEHWQRLSELASLSSADATAAFIKKNEQTVIEHLIEPFDWPVKPTLNLQQYPGSLNLQNGATISLSETTALQGISGKFVETNNGQITGTTEADNPYIIEAGSMAARADGKGGFRDQRGLVRFATTATPKLLKTPVTFHKEKGNSQAYELISALEAVSLQIGDQQQPGQIGNQQQPWEIWFRDLPVRVETGSFTRQSTISEQAEDINDPEALSRDHNFLTGYEWRLAQAKSEADFVSIFNLRFYPLTLEQVSIQGDRIDNITLVGRLQLPLTNGGELKDFNNAVRLKFERNSTLNQLKLAAIELEARPRPDSALPGTFKIQIDEPSKTWVLSWTGAMTPAQETALQTLPGDADFKLGINKLIKQVRQQPSPTPTATFTQAISFIPPGSEFGEWPLALQSGEASDAPRLLWKKISLNSDRNRIDVETLQLTFFLFGTEWSVKLDAGNEETSGKIDWKTPSKKLSFPLTESGKLIEGTYTFPPPTTLEPLAGESLKLAVDVASDKFNHEASLLLGVQLGRERVADGLQVLYTFTEGKGNLVKDVSGVGEPLNLTVENSDAIAWLTNRGLAINNSTVLKSTNAATKIIQACKATNEITIEAWIKPAKATSPNRGIPARIVALSPEGRNSNFALQQGLRQQQPTSDFYAVRLRTTHNDADSALVTPAGSVKTDLTHLVYTKNVEGEARLYINGVKQANNTVEGDFSNWDDNYPLTLANDLNRERPWQGEFHLVALYSCALSAAEVRQNYQAGLDTLPIRERSAFEAKVRFGLVGSQQNIKVAWESASLFRDMEVGVKDGSILFTENALQFQWSSYKPKYSDLQLLPGMHVTSGDAPGFAALTFDTETGQEDIPKLRLKTAFIESLVLCQWGTFLQMNSLAASQKPIVADESAQVYGSSAGDLVFGYTAQWQKQKGWNESLLLNGFLEIKNLISWPKAMSIKSQGNVTKLILPPAQALNHIRHTIRILLNQHSIPAELLVVGKDELLFQLARNQSWQFLAVVEHQLIDVLPGTQLTLENDRRWTTVQEVRLTLPDTFRQFLLAQRGISTIDPIEGVDGLEYGNSGYLAVKLRTQLAEGNTPELDKLSADTLLVEASAPHWVRKKPVLGASATTLQFLPNGSQQAILSNLQDYEPSDPQAPEWLLLTMPFLGRLQDKKADRLELLSNSKPQPPTNPATFSPLQVDPILCLATKILPDLSLALNFSSWGNTANVEIAVSNLDTAVGRTWSRLDPLSLEENWFRLQNPLTEPKLTELQSVMAALPDTPARLSRSTALQNAFNAYRESYPPVTADDNPPIQAVAITPDGQRAISGSDDGTLRFWDLQNGQLLQILKGHTDKVRSVAITPDRQRAVSGSDDGTVKFWDLDNGQVLQTLQGHTGKVRSVDITPDRQRAISGSDDGTVKVWNLDNGQVLRSLQGHTKAVTSVAITPDRQRAISGSIDGTLNLWDVRNGQVLRSLQAHTKAITSVAITPDRQRAVSSSEDGTVKFWDVENGQLLQTLQGHTDKVRSVAITPDRQRAVSGSDDGTVKLWDLNNGELLDTLQAHSGGVGAVAITPDRQWAISGSDDGTVKLWNVENGEVLRTLQSRIDRVDVGSDLRFAAALRYRIVWRQNSLLVIPTVGSDRQSEGPAYNWYLTGLQLLSSGLLAKPENSGNLPRRHAAATVLPALLKLYDRANPVPLSFTVSPYLGLEFKPAKTIDKYELLLVSTELLCLDKASGTLLPVASHFWEDLEGIDTRSRTWAKETHLRLSPESPIAILRFRSVKKLEVDKNVNSDTETAALLTTTYSFAIASEIQTPQRLAKRVFRLRSTVTKLRFREGQFGGNQLPTKIQPFEIAPPQTTGVQPLYLTQRPKTEPSKTWPWGLSAIRMSVQYTEGKKAAIGSVGKSSGNTTLDALALWWQAPQHMVQYRSASSANGPTVGLPPHFRATAIKSLLPVLPAPPLPSISQQETFNSQDRTKFRDEFQRWQPVLPGAVRYLMIGDRSGAMFAIRNQLLRQNDFQQSKTGAVMVSGSIPVQHRMPRPVPLPPNQNPDKALQTWASYFAEGRTHTLLATSSPADEAFFAAFGTPPNQQPAQRLQMKLNSPAWGAINSQWDGELEFKLNFEENISVTDAWDIEVEVNDAGQRFKYQNTKTDKLEFRFTPLQKELLQQRLVNKATGDTLTVSAKVKPKAATNNFSQTLAFQLHIVDPTALPLPLQPYFIHFEDPEYNRQLASPAAHASGNVSVQVGQELVSHTVKLSVDRREYNPDSLLSLRYDWDDDRKDTATLELVRINSDGAIAPLKRPANLPAKISSGKLEQWSLAEIQEINGVQLQQGDTLQLKLVVQGVKPVEIFLQVRIVQAPVISATEAAYALLRQRTSQGSSVECVRFAWSPEATRMELVCAEDLRTEVVRRRAVFHWLDSVRLGTLGGYAIQKITKTGSTHFPTSQELEEYRTYILTK